MVARLVLAWVLPRDAWQAPAALASALRGAASAALNVHGGAWAVAEPALGPRFASAEQGALRRAWRDARSAVALPPSWPQVGAQGAQA